jgi:hypothetical protein
MKKSRNFFLVYAVSICNYLYDFRMPLENAALKLELELELELDWN